MAREHVCHLPVSFFSSKGEASGDSRVEIGSWLMVGSRKSRLLFCFVVGPSITTTGLNSELIFGNGWVTLRSIDLRSAIADLPSERVRPFGVMLVFGDCGFPEPKGRRLRNERKVDLLEPGVAFWTVGLAWIDGLLGIRDGDCDCRASCGNDMVVGSEDGGRVATGTGMNDVLDTERCPFRGSAISVALCC